MQDERAEAVKLARQQADQRLAEAKITLSAEVEQLKGRLASDAEEMSERIVNIVLNGRAA
jgi:hypothetical protein